MNYERIVETLTNDQFIPRVRELEARGASFWKVRLLIHNLGYAIQCDVPIKTAAQVEQAVLPI